MEGDGRILPPTLLLDNQMRDGQPVVALESTIIAHGMPHPQNLETAQALEQTTLIGSDVIQTIAAMSDADVMTALGEPVVVDYVRLNIDARV